ncbi:LpqB family beta-propeller domain-containing protein [Microbacterium telephonicum]|uniref:Lipoprotein LpqB-like beta-propeller protein n=1 Tax=Microbacterium telephonicum TaxID=1714841 RepID=A0A498BVY9_9MICO|nr:LpqB family beta-propeller domain-containing protein [Microbacterium telephonicum]RLK47725.1 lipoprotein LpqB-like beta-propeller protein [Microbacterium telephonicum]
MTARPLRAALAAASLLIVMALAACAGLPTSGPVRIGQAGVEDGEPPFAYVPNGPAEGMTPQQIVDGFIAAGSGPRSDWQTAQLFLSEEARAVWKPAASVTVYAPGDRTVTTVSDERIVVGVIPEATVDATGAYVIAEGTQPTELTYQLAQQADGEWRITQAPDGIVLDTTRFQSVFRPYSLMYFDPDWRYLVPEQRWFPVETAATRITEALVEGAPSPWLASAVRTSFTESAGLAQRSVPVRQGAAEVTLRSAARGLDQGTLDRMQTQLEMSLATAGIMDVEMLVDGQTLAASVVPVRDTRVDARMIVQSEGAFGFLSGDEITPIPGLSGAVVAADAESVEVAADRAVAAVRTRDGVVARASADGTVTVLDTRAGVLAPTIDPDGYIYVVPADEPDALVAYAPDGTAFELTGAWTGASRILSVRVSRDGTRIAAVVREGTQSAVWIASIIRDDDGAPASLSGERTPLAVLDGDGISLTWLDGVTTAVVYTSGEDRYLRTQPVGGPGTVIRAREGTVSVAGGNQSGSARLRDADGGLFVQRGSTWQQVDTGVDLLAVQQGTPQ